VKTNLKKINTLSSKRLAVSRSHTFIVPSIRQSSSNAIDTIEQGSVLFLCVSFVGEESRQGGLWLFRLALEEKRDGLHAIYDAKKKKKEYCLKAEQVLPEWSSFSK
jgi:hypothetical protein